MNTYKELEEKVNSFFGAKTKIITHLSSEGEKRVIYGLSSGSIMLNLALSGVPSVGYAWGKIIEIYGPEMSGKTTLALHAIYEAQKLKLPTIFIDAEHACDPTYMKNIGLNLEELSFVQPDYGEQSLEVVIEAVKAGYKLVVIDSVAALTPLAELEGDMTDAHMGKQARMMGQGLRKMTSIVFKQKAIVIFINQIRQKLGVFFGNPETTPGGKALKFFACYRLEIRSPRSGKIQEKNLDKETVESGIEAHVTVQKNKVFPPYRKASFNIIYGKGIDRITDLVEFLIYKKLFIFDKKGTMRFVVGEKSYTKNGLIESIGMDKKLLHEIILLAKKEIK